MYNSIAIINRCLKEKKHNNYVFYNNTNLDIIKLLYNNNYILCYTIKYNKIFFEFNLNENKMMFNLFCLYKKMHNRKNITYSKLRYYYFIKNKKLLLGTSKGIITSEMALKYKIGGSIILQYN